MSSKIRVLVVDDSALVRHAITQALELDPDIEVVGVANDPLIAMEKIPRLQPDVMTLDLEMPRMDGLTYLRQLKAEKSKLPVLVISSLTQQGSQLALQAMEAGASDVLGKPDGSTSIGSLAGQLAFHVKAAARSRRRVDRVSPVAMGPAAAMPNLPLQRRHSGAEPDRRLIVIGSSTGGIEALRYLLPSLPNGLPPMVVVQHIPAFFSGAVAARLNDLSPFEVREAVDDEPLRPGLCLMAPGNFHLSLVQLGGFYRTRLSQSPAIHHCRPAVDVLFRSAAAAAGAHTLAVLLTGMGVDGARGMQKIKQAGGQTLAEHEDSCVVYGMPRAAVELGVVDRSVHLRDMPQAVLHAVHALPA